MMALPFLLLASIISALAQFPTDFFWGTATASYQVEGAWNQDMRGPSIWDTFSHAGRCYNNDTGDVADDHYNRVKEDIQIMKELGISHYRMSFSWTRIFPTGEGHVNQKGVDHYNMEINALLAAGITPFITLFHWDLPQPFQDRYGGWLQAPIQDKFSAYAEFCFKTFGDRVKHWLTLNEPHTVAINGYYDGVHAPGRCSDRAMCPQGDGVTEPYIVAHNMLLSHAKAVKIYREKFSHQNGSIGLALDSAFGVPLTDRPADVEAATRFMEFFVGWFADPIFGKDGDYPASMRKNVGNRLPRFSPQEKNLLKGSADFFALNHYTSSYISDTNRSGTPGYNNDQKLISSPFKNGKPIGPRADSPWLYVYPPGIAGILNWLHKRYGPDTHFIITENGCDVPGENQMPIPVALKDTFRVNYYKDYLYYLETAIKQGIKVKGYFAWSLMDNFEWNDGYHFRFGLHYVDYTTQRRYQKDSAKFFKNFITSQ